MKNSDLMTLKRHQQIIAFKEPQTSSSPGNFIAFHADNLEVAEISEEAFMSMSPISVLTSEVPELQNETSSDGLDQIQNWNNEMNPDVRSGQIDFGIRSLTINVTQICNLKCTYCAAGGDGTYGDPMNKISVEKTLPQLKFFMDKVPAGKKFSISFVGGEPLLYPEGIKAIYDYVSEIAKTNSLQPVFMITTNGTLITEPVIEMIKATKLHMTISLDGDKDTNDKLRPTKNNKGSTDLTIDGLNKLNSIRQFIPSLGISAVFNEQAQDVLATYEFFKKFKPDWVEFNFAYSQNNSAIQQKYIEQMNLLAATAWQEGGEAAVRRIKTFDHYFNLLDSQQRVQNHCGAGKSYLMVDAQNRLYTCPWVVGNKDEVVGYGANLDQNKLEKYQKSLITLNNCQTCWAKYLCGGGCMYIHQAHTGEKHKKDSLFCERTRSLILISLLYYKKARVENESTH